MTDYRQMPWRLVALAALVLAACGGSDSGSQQPDASQAVALTVQRAFPGLTFASPVAMVQAPRDSTRWFVVEQAGQVRVFDNNPAVVAAALFVDIDGMDRVTFSGEAGLLGMAFHPDFPADPRVYLFYSHTENGVLVSRLSKFTTSDNGLTLSPNSEQILLTIKKPEVNNISQANHNGGGIAFGPDDFLYVGVGDGGGANDGGASNQHGAIGNGQSLTTLLGKMLRIDVDGTPYEIPPTNPFASSTTLCGTDGTGPQSCPEIFALGFRNPWRWSFDRLTDELWVADVGQNALEEVDRVTLGSNYGWRCFEGTRDAGLACGSLPKRLPPVAQYDRTVGRSTTGGYVYRGSAIASLVGRYVFGDFVTGRIFNIAATVQPTLMLTDGFASSLNISSFGEGNDGELYVVDYGGELYRISP